MATQSDREIELSQTNRGVGGVCVGVVPSVQPKLSRALHAHRGKKLLQDLQTQESAATKRAMVRFRGAREKGAMCVCVCFLPIHSGHQVRWTYQPGSHRRKVTQDFSSTFFLRCVP